MYSIIYNVNAWKTGHSFPVNIYQILLKILEICILYYIELVIIFFFLNFTPYSFDDQKIIYFVHV